VRSPKHVLALFVLATGCRVATPAQSIAVRTAGPNQAQHAAPSDEPMPTMSTVGMWIQLTEHGWGRQTMAVYANGKVVSLVWGQDGLRTAEKHVHREILEAIRAAAEHVGLWTLKPHCCDCSKDRAGGVDDGRRITFQFFEPEKVTDLEYWQCGLWEYGDLARLADQIYDIVGRTGWLGPDGKVADSGLREKNGGCYQEKDGGCCSELRPTSR
jgi:hypothetical protein